MWVIRGGEHDRLADRFVDEGWIGLEYPTVPDAEILTRSEIRRFLGSEHTTAALDKHEAMLSAFVREVQVGNSVLLLDPDRGEVVAGTVTGAYEFVGDEAASANHRRAVEWLVRHAVADLPSAVQGVAKQKLTLEQHRDAEWAGYVAQAREHLLGRDPKDRPARPIRAARSTSSSPRRASAPATPRAVKAAVAQRTCPSCFLQTHPNRFRGDVCMDCAE